MLKRMEKLAAGVVAIVPGTSTAPKSGVHESNEEEGQTGVRREPALIEVEIAKNDFMVL